MPELLTKLAAKPLNGRYVQRSGDCGITLQRFARSHTQGRYLLRMRGHAVALVDGIVHDLGEPKWRSIIRGAWRFEEVA